MSRPPALAPALEAAAPMRGYRSAGQDLELCRQEGVDRLGGRWLLVCPSYCRNACRDPKPAQAPPAPLALPEELASAQEELAWL